MVNSEKYRILTSTALFASQIDSRWNFKVFRLDLLLLGRVGIRLLVVQTFCLHDFSLSLPYVDGLDRVDYALERSHDLNDQMIGRDILLLYSLLCSYLRPSGDCELTVSVLPTTIVHSVNTYDVSRLYYIVLTND